MTLAVTLYVFLRTTGKLMLSHSHALWYNIDRGVYGPGLRSTHGLGMRALKRPDWGAVPTNIHGRWYNSMRYLIVVSESYSLAKSWVKFLTGLTRMSHPARPAPTWRLVTNHSSRSKNEWTTHDLIYHSNLIVPPHFSGGGGMVFLLPAKAERKKKRSKRDNSKGVDIEPCTERQLETIQLTDLRHVLGIEFYIGL
ncbi:hypothetical protein F5X99DRAFT_132192 [Biscogniauxia marginata]|nr:hypothetical protein F5X99DRAFT_132192 [Biscogniauxia marginata]